MSFLTYVSSIVEGFCRGYQANYSYNEAEAVRRGASPNRFMLTMLKVASSITTSLAVVKCLALFKWMPPILGGFAPFFAAVVPIIINGLPREGADNSAFIRLKEILREGSRFLLQRNSRWLKGVAWILYSAHWLLNKIPSIRNPYLIKALFLLDKYFFEISFFFTALSYAFLFFAGQVFMAAAAGITLLLGVLDNRNLLPHFIRNFIKRIGIPASLCYMLLNGTVIERLLSIILLPVYFSSLLSSVLTLKLKKLLIWLGPGELATELREQDKKVSSFDFKCAASDFKQRLQAMKGMPCEVVRAHALDNVNLLPLSLNDVDLDILLTSFDSINWNKHQRSIETKWQMDWQRRQEEIESVGLGEQTFDEKVRFLRENLKKFIEKVKTGNIQFVTLGTEDLLKKYVQNIAVILGRLPSTEEIRKVDALLLLSFEGDYCGPGIIRIVEECYRALIHRQEGLNLMQCVRFIHQMNREYYFNQQYSRYREGMEELFGMAGLGGAVSERNDMHAYSFAVYFFAPRLGLPVQFAEHDQSFENVSSLERDLISASVGIERIFWKKTPVDSLKKQIMEQVNTELLPIALVDRWYEQFVDGHVCGTEEEKEKLKEEYRPYEVKEEKDEYNRPIYIYQLKPEILHLMLLDFGVIALSKRPGVTENYFRPADFDENVHHTIRRQSKNLLMHFDGNRRGVEGRMALPLPPIQEQEENARLSPAPH